MGNYEGSVDQHYGSRTYSQHGEDLCIVNLFKLMNIPIPTYLDAGASHPSHISNTKLLHDRGSRGVNVEANPNLIAAFERERPDDINLNVGVGLQDGIADFHMFDECSGRNTFSKEEADRFSAEQPEFQIKEIKKIKVTTLEKILHMDQYFTDAEFPHFLSCDLEGLDYDVLKATTFREGLPAVICVESRRDKSADMVHMMIEKNYFLHSRMGENLIFVHDKYMAVVY